ncbi:MAG: alcohol dehydrogenase catalytic domain-containing protein, partial [Candidatus Eremiobacteraeota bacterium]|nr:alcohol dehydrogenase catalytic domain-containing protein [Candidatus Eremiobacteraeota bacterium]
MIAGKTGHISDSREARMMLALCKSKPEPGFSLTDVRLPAIGPSEVLIRVEKVGLCGTDQHIYNWDNWAQSRVKPPLIVGHEFMGRVCETGAAVRSIAVG